jgi:biotin carboxyl carrier protein
MRGAGSTSLGAGWHVTAVDGCQFSVTHGERRYVAFAIAQNDRVHVFIEGDIFEIESDKGPARRREGATHTDVLMSPMPATVIRLLVAEGDRVTNGDTLALLEAMKMELPIRAPRDATVRKVSCREGDLVQPNDVLIELE